MGGDPGEVVVLLASATPPPAAPPLIGGVPLAVDPAGLFVLFDGTVDPAAVLPPGGSVALPLSVPSTLPVGAAVYLQAALLDFTTFGARLTNGLAPATAGEPLTHLDQGELSGHPQAFLGGTLVITDAAAWSQFWNLHTTPFFPPPPLPAVDFSQEAVVAHFLGMQTIGGILLTIDAAIFQGAGAGLGLETTVHVPGAGCPVPQVITYPFSIAAVPMAVVGPVQVIQSTVNFKPCS